MTDLAAWLEAEFGRVEELARAAGGDAWTVHEHPSDSVAVYDSRREPVVYDEGWPSDGQKQHIVEHDPAAVLRRVKADRELLAEHESDGGDCRVCAGPLDFSDDSEGNREWSRSAETFPCRTVRLLAEAWGWTGS